MYKESIRVTKVNWVYTIVTIKSIRQRALSVAL